MRRREFLAGLTTGIGSVAMPAAVFRSEQPADFRVYEYKRADGCVIKADVYGVNELVQKPVLMYIHGGALIGGTRMVLASWIGPLRQFILAHPL